MCINLLCGMPDKRWYEFDTSRVGLPGVGGVKEHFGDVEDKIVALIFCNGWRGRKEWVGDKRRGYELVNMVDNT